MGEDDVTLASTTDSEDEIRAALGQESPAASGAEKKPQPSPEASEEEAQAAGATEEPEQEEQEPGKKPGKTRRDKRIDQLTREKYEAQRRAEAAEHRLAESAGIQRRAQPEKPAEKPDPENYETTEAYVDALTDWKVEQHLAAYDDRVKEERRREHELAQTQQVLTTWAERLQTAATKYPDLNEVMDSDLPISTAMREAIFDSELGPDIAYYLGKNPDVCERIARSSPVAAIREIGKIEAALATDGAAPAPNRQPKVPSAPKPITPVGARGDKTAVNPDQMDYQTFKRWRQKEIADNER